MHVSLSIEIRQGDLVRAALRPAQMLTSIVIVLAAIAAAGGIWLSGLYAGPAALTPILQGQDLVTLLALPVLVWALVAAGRGSTRAVVVWLGILGYLLYTYTGAAIAYPMNRFFLIYIALFALCIFATVATATRLDVDAVQRSFDGRAPRRAVAGFLVFIAVSLGTVELAQVIAYLVSGTVPAIMLLTEADTCFVYVLDVGLVVPLCLLAAYWLWRRQAWGDVLAGVMLIKGATMGLALLSMNWFAVQSGGTTDGLEMLWAAIAFGCLGVGAWFLRHCRA